MSLPRKIAIGFLLLISIYLIVQGNFIENEREQLYAKATSTIAEVIEKGEIEQIKHTSTKTVKKNGKNKKVTSTSYTYEQKVTLEYKIKGTTYSNVQNVSCPKEGLKDNKTYTVYVDNNDPNTIYFDNFGSGIGLIYSGYFFLIITVLTSIKPIIRMIKNKTKREA